MPKAIQGIRQNLDKLIAKGKLSVDAAADAVNQGVATVAEVDTAMRKGVNYPRGRLAWADEVGIEAIQKVLVIWLPVTEEIIYRISPKIRQLVAIGGAFWNESGG